MKVERAKRRRGPRGADGVRVWRRRYACVLASIASNGNSHMKVSIQELRMLTLALGVSVAAGVSGQAPAPAASATLTAPSTAPTPATIAQLDWLHGCWDGVYYVAAPSGKNETAFRLTGKTVDGDDQMFTFDNPAGEFPQRIVYRQGTKGWLYAEVQGTIKGQDHKVIYPMRRVDCQSGELIEK
jgi:hypothetical protein